MILKQSASSLVLNRGCTLSSPMELLKIPVPGSHRRDSDLNHLGRDLGISIFEGSAGDSNVQPSSEVHRFNPIPHFYKLRTPRMPAHT